ncbi:MAG: DsbA family protein [Propionibacteriaceae bacterium]|nr:DsbA family protein [Propionibacteriaceae bacterium]
MSQPIPPSPQADQARRSTIVAVTVGVVAVIGVALAILLPKLGQDETAPAAAATSAAATEAAATEAASEPATEAPTEAATEAQCVPSDPPVALPTVTPPNANATLSGIVVNPEAPADHILVIYQDYQCPVCAQADAIFGDVIKQAVADNKIRVEYRTMTFLDRVNASGDTYQSSTRAANAAACADKAGFFFDYQNYLMENQVTEGVGYTDAQLTEDIPAALGVTGDALSVFQQCYADQEYDDFVYYVYAAASYACVTGTPTYMIDGQTLSLSTAAQLQADIDAAVA